MSLKLKTGNQLADAGIQRAVDHADHEGRDWSIQIIREFKNWVARQPHAFAIEDFRLFVELRRRALVPPSPNAWGYLSRAGLSLGIVEHVGYRQAKSRKTHGHRVMVFARKSA
jgi:hypothetical protein